VPRVAIRRLQLRGLAPRDHPSPADLQARLVEAAQRHLPDALAEAVAPRRDGTVLRIRRLEVDISLGAEVEAKAFAAALARAIAAAIGHAADAATENGDGVIGFPSRAHHLVALLEALADGRAVHCWWLRDADGLAFLSRPVALRTAILADPVIGTRALRLQSPGRRSQLTRLLGLRETDRVMDGLAEAAETAATASFDACAAAIAAVAAQTPPPLEVLNLYLSAVARDPGLAGRMLLETVRAFLRIDRARADARLSDASAMAIVPDGPTDQAVRAMAARLPESARRILLRESVHRATDPATRPRAEAVFTQFGGLLLLLPTLGYCDIVDAVADREVAALVAYAALGLCAGRCRFGSYLGDPLWRELFGLDVQAASQTVRDRLIAIPTETWLPVAQLGQTIDRQRDARFLLAEAGPKAARRALAMLARVTLARFTRRLWGFRDGSAPFLWAKLLDVNAVLERRSDGWSARLARPPLDIVLSLGGIAEDTVTAPTGARIQLTRVAA
jgi:hypothetical protein